MDNEPLRQSRKPMMPPTNQEPAREGGLNIEGPVPDAFKAALAKHRQENSERPVESEPTPRVVPQNMAASPLGPRLGFTGDPKLDELLNKIKQSASYDEVVLPSLGKFYDGAQGPTTGVLHIRPMTGEEENILGTPRFVKRGLAMNMIYRNCVQERIIPEKLLVVDRTFLLIYLRAISHTPEYEVEVKCPACASRFSTTLDLDKLPIVRCPEDFGPESLADELPTTRYKFTYRLATAEDEQRVSTHRERRVKMFGDHGADDTWLYRTALLISDIEGLSDKDSLQILISRLPVNDVAYLRNVVNDPPFGMETKVQVVCAICSEDFEIELPMEANFFFPRKKKGNPTRA